MLRATGAHVDDAEALLVVQRTEGWPAAIYLAGLLLRDGDAAVAGGRDRAGRSAPRRVRARRGPRPRRPRRRRVPHALVDPRRAAPEICDAVLERSDSADRLRALVDANLLVTPGDVYGTTFRVHALFRSLLRAELRRQGPDAERALHRRAAAVFRERQDSERAIRHALAAGDDGDAADVVWEVGPAMIAGGRGAHARSLVPVVQHRVGRRASAGRPRPRLGGARGRRGGGRIRSAPALALASPRPSRSPTAPRCRRWACSCARPSASSGNAQAAADAQAAAAAIPRDYPLRGDRAAPPRSRSRCSTATRSAAQRAPGRRPSGSRSAASRPRTPSCSPTWRCSRSTTAAGTRPTRMLVQGPDGAARRGPPGLHDAGRRVGGPGADARPPRRPRAGTGRRRPGRDEPRPAPPQLALARAARPAWRWPGRARSSATAGRRAPSSARSASSPVIARSRSSRTGPIARSRSSRASAATPAARPSRRPSCARCSTSRRTSRSARSESGSHVSRNTVKTHTVAIYRKLEVASRSEAVVTGPRARPPRRLSGSRPVTRSGRGRAAAAR